MRVVRLPKIELFVAHEWVRRSASGTNARPVNRNLPSRNPGVTQAELNESRVEFSENAAFQARAGVGWAQYRSVVDEVVSDRIAYQVRRCCEVELPQCGCAMD